MKFNEDSCFSNQYKAMVSGVDQHELLDLELSFLKLIDFRLYVSPDIFESYYEHLVETSGRRALLYNWSCLDPAHSYKVYSHIIKNKTKHTKEVRHHEIRPALKSNDGHELLQKDPDYDYFHDTWDSDSQVIQQIEYNPDRKNKKWRNENNVLEEELRITLELADSRYVTSFSKDAKKKENLIEKSIKIEANRTTNNQVEQEIDTSKRGNPNRNYSNNEINHKFVISQSDKYIERETHNPISQKLSF